MEWVLFFVLLFTVILDCCLYFKLVNQNKRQQQEIDYLDLCNTLNEEKIIKILINQKKQINDCNECNQTKYCRRFGED